MITVAKKYVNQSQGPGNYNMNTLLFVIIVFKKIIYKCKKQVYL